ncbi:MAG: SH3 domain-containing protein [Fusobacterium perfoetens]|uniref:L,D-transpeptidase family protein n=1 Tax=Fusobacterium perfoetens TaxID=852 RepID=UPI0023F57154|nr:SH3 domain-containing protein [Fusobacterium perfoetens]MCI6152151.1 SH3 domain-containing protein [Fusobacterium perfoetens]MDY3237958.1 SH3 domain-containing protein [Fusobacterium perfoetens]
MKKRLIGIIFILFTTIIFGKKSNIVVENRYDNLIHDDIKVDIKYKENDLPELLDYVFIKTLYAIIREEPNPKSEVIYNAPFNTKYQLLEKVKVGESYWYKVKTSKGIGYVFGNNVDVKTFRFEKMLERIKDVEKFINENNQNNIKLASTNSYLPNPYNKDMKRTKDKYGISIDQNIVGVYEKENIELHIPDRSVLSVLKINGNKAEVKVEGIPESPLVIDKKYLSYNPKIEEGFEKAIVVDIENQNLAAFEKINGEWTLISYIYAKTGLESQLGFETPRGSFIVPLLKYEMGYRDIYGADMGIARYAIRFSGGGYLHGTPVDHVEVDNEDFFLKQKEDGLGTFKGTRKCIRNTVSHAKFLFDWILGDERNQNSNYQKPQENVMFIIF